MGKRLYVGNLPYSSTAESLRSLFGACGTVDDATVVSDRETGRSKGFGFVEMATDEEARAAIDKMNGQTVDGRQIKVDEARPAERSGGGGGGGGRGGYGGGGGRNRY